MYIFMIDAMVLKPSGGRTPRQALSLRLELGNSGHTSRLHCSHNIEASATLAEDVKQGLCNK